MRLLRYVSGQRDALQASRAAEARAAAAAERGRLAREMHDVLAHSLSALALQLETTRLLARDRGVDDQITQAIDRAHHLAASGLDEARRAIAAERGDELPGPERIGALADAFKQQSGLPVAVEVRGEPRELAPEARLAVYRTAQEALTNVRRHATAERVDVRLDYGPDQHRAGSRGSRRSRARPPPAAISLTGGYGLTGMRERAELLGGELLAEPTPSGFRIELRLPASRMSDAGPQREPVRVLLADDQRLVRESLGMLLGLLAGIELVATASDGEEALALTDQHKPDVVLMDLRMPRAGRDRGHPAAARAPTRHSRDCAHHLCRRRERARSPARRRARLPDQRRQQRRHPQRDPHRRGRRSRAGSVRAASRCCSAGERR